MIKELACTFAWIKKHVEVTKVMAINHARFIFMRPVLLDFTTENR